MYDSPELVDILNREIQEYPGLQEVLELIQFRFTAILFKPRKEAELQFNARFQQKGQSFLEEIAAEERKTVAAISSVTNTVAGVNQSVRRSIESIDGLISDQGLILKTVSGNLSKMRTGEELEEAIKDIYPCQDLRQRAKRLAEACNALAKELRRLDEQRMAIIEGAVETEEVT